MRICLIFMALSALPASCWAQSCNSPSILSGASVRYATNNPQAARLFVPRLMSFKQAFPLLKTEETPLRLPVWRAESLPFFCRIEHQWGKKMALPVKFRLGSVEYVDWLEGK